MSDSADMIKDLLVKANGLCKISQMFSDKLAPYAEPSDNEDEEDTATIKKADLKSALELLESFPTVLQLLSGHINTVDDKYKAELVGYKQREAEWEKLTELFNTFKKKLTEDLAASESVNKKMSSEMELLNRENALLKQHSKLLQQKMATWEDIMIKIEANHRRKKNLEQIQRDLEADDEGIANAIHSLLKLDK